MIRYPKVYWGLGTLTYWYGSAIPRALPFSLAAGLLAALLEEFTSLGKHGGDAPDGKRVFLHPYPFQAFAFIAGFMIVFRSNLSYNRYWEGRTQLQKLASKLSDIVVQALTFDYETLPRDISEEALLAHWRFRDNFIHLVSLLHAVALLTLRTDYNMENLSAHDSLEAAPPSQLRSLRHVQVDQSSASEAQTYASEELPDTDTRSKMMLLPDMGWKSDRKERAEAKKHGSSKRDYRSSGGHTSILDYFLLRTGEEHAAKMCARMPLPVIGGFTQDEGIALGAMLSSGRGKAFLNLNESIHGFLLDNGNYAPAPTERVHTVHAWLQHTLMQRIVDGGLATSSSVQARIHANISDAMGAYEQCKKLNETPFPFPWAQGIVVVLMIFTISVPFVFAMFIHSTIAAAIASAAAVQTYIMMNEVANDVEDPFHHDPNQLPLPQMQYRLNERLLAVSKTERPLAFTDVGAIDGPSNIPQLPPESMAPDDDGANGVSPPQSSVSQQEGPGTSPSMMGQPLKAYSTRNEIDPAFLQAIEQRSTFWESKAGSSGNKRAPTPYCADQSGGGYIPQWRIPQSLGGNSFERSTYQAGSLFGGSIGSVLPRQAHAAKNPGFVNGLVTGTSGSSVGSERGMHHVRAQSPNVHDRRARHIARWLATPPVVSAPSNLTRPSLTQSTIAPEHDNSQDLPRPHQHMQEQHMPPPPAKGPWRDASLDAPPVLGADGAKAVKGGVMGVFPVGTPVGTSGVSGISVGGVSGISNASSMGGTSLAGGGMQHANNVRVMQSAAVFRRAATSRQSSLAQGYDASGSGHAKNSAKEEAPLPAVAQQGTQRIQDASGFGLTTSSQATHDGTTVALKGNTGGLGAANSGDMIKNAVSGLQKGAVQTGSKLAPKGLMEGSLGPKKRPPSPPPMRHPAERRRSPHQAAGGISTSSSSSLDSSVPPVAPASHVCAVVDAVENSPQHSIASIAPPATQQAAQHVASGSTNQKSLPPRSPSADPAALLGLVPPTSPSPNNCEARSNSFNANMHAPHASSSPTGGNASTSASVARNEALRNEVAGDFAQRAAGSAQHAARRKTSRSPDSTNPMIRERSLSFRPNSAHVRVSPNTPEDTAVFPEPQWQQDRGYRAYKGGNDLEEGEEAELPEVASPHRDMMGGGGGGGTSRGGAESTSSSGALRMGSVQRASAWGGSAAGSRQSSMARMSSAGAGAHARATSTMSQGISPAGGTILEDGAASIYQDIDIPAPTSGLDGGRPQEHVAMQDRMRGHTAIGSGPALRSAAMQLSMRRDRD